MASKGTGDQLAVWEAFLRAHTLISDSLNRELQQERGMPLAWYEVLLYLTGSPDRRMRLQDLADRVMYSRSGLTRLIDRMEAAKLVRREPCVEDRRGTWAVATGEGRRAFRRAAPTHVHGIERHFLSRLTDQEIEVMRCAFERLASPAKPKARAV